jgi:predicted amidophosphoribosyltransferase
MTQEKFQGEVKTLEKFFTKFCEDKHDNQYNKTYALNYKSEIYELKLCLCDDCQNLISYSLDRLKECPYEIKPRCRKCPNPCYDKVQWKQLAKLMRYSGIQLGLTKIKKIFKK